MNKNCGVIATALCLLAILAAGFSQDCSGVRIGDLPTHYHNVRGELYVEDEYTFCIRNFSYDGGGPDAFLYFYYPGDPFSDTGGGVIINITTQASGRPQFDLGVEYNDVAFYRFTLPRYQFRACDFGSFSIWCRYANAHFTTLAWNYTDVFSMVDTSGRITCIPSPGRGYAGLLPTLSNTVGGQFYFVNNKTMAIRNFTYASNSSEVFIYWYPPGTPPATSGGGKIIRVSGSAADSQTGAFLTTFTGTPDADFWITVNETNVYTCDIGTFTIWCRTCKTFYTWLPINLEVFSNNPYEVAYEPNKILCNRTTTRPGVYLGELPTTNARTVSGSFYVYDETTFFIQLFSLDTTKYEDVYLYYFPTGVDVSNDGTGGGSINVSSTMSKFGTLSNESYYNVDFTVNLKLAKKPIKTCEIGYFTIWSKKSKLFLTKIRIPSAVFYDKEDESRPGAVLCAAGAVRVAMSYLLAGLLAVLAYVFTQ